jgi:ribosomal protein S18 acetylase RimI-like enzyme
MSITIRPAGPADGEALGRMGESLARLHSSFDPQRFLPPEGLAAGYRSWLLREAKAKDAVVLVAELEGRVVGYAYGRLEERDWNALLDAHAGFHDLWVDPEARSTGAGKALAEALIEALTKLGAKQIVLSASPKNETAQRLFVRLGFRPTMVEMTRG